MAKRASEQEQKIWYVRLNGKEHGPFAAFALGGLRGLTPETLIWRHGFLDWTPIGHVVELAFLFKDEGDIDDWPVEEEDDSDQFTDKSRRAAVEGATAVIKMEPNQFIFWFVVIVLLITYLLYRQGV